MAKCSICENQFVPDCGSIDTCLECQDMDDNDFDVDGYDDYVGENDDILEQQELEDYCETDEAYGRWNEDYYDDYQYDDDRDFGMDG